jgi:transcriptional repressor NrdR
MRCPFCGQVEDKVVDSRSSRDGATIRRRRECLTCGERFTTYETLENAAVTIVKRDGRREPYEREKILRGVRLACKKRPVDDDQVERIVDDVEVELFARPDREVESAEVGKMVLTRLEQVDKVAYIRFASVYKDFKTTGAFLDELKHLTK